MGHASLGQEDYVLRYNTTVQVTCLSNIKILNIYQ